MTRMARCSCGLLRAEVSADPIYVIACHCDECQRRTGSVLGVAGYYEKEQVQISGPNKVFVRAAPENRTVSNHFCPECGTSLFWEGDIAPGIVGVAVGGFVDPDFPPPDISFFEKYKHPWVGFNHEPKHFLQRPTDPLWSKDKP
jgi:hypothetical protein